VPKQLRYELPSLDTLTVTWTRIRSVPPAVFQLPLVTLNLPANRIASLDGLERVTRLTVLDLSQNSLETLPDVFVHLTSLEVSDAFFTVFFRSFRYYLSLRESTPAHEALRAVATGVYRYIYPAKSVYPKNIYVTVLSP